MLVTISPVVHPRICEPPYLLKTLDFLKEKLDDSYHFIIARTNDYNEIQQFKSCLKPDKKKYINIIV